MAGPSTQPAAQRGNEVATINGRPHRVVRDAQGNVVGYEAIPISGTRKPWPEWARTWRPDLGKPSAGLLELQDRPHAALSSGEIDDETANDILSTVQATAKAEVDRVLGIEGIQRDVFETNVGQRRDDIGETASRRAAAGTAFGNALTMGSKMLLPWEAVMQMVELQRAEAERWGGIREHPREQPGPMTQGVMGIGYPSGQSSPPLPPDASPIGVPPANAPSPADPSVMAARLSSVASGGLPPRNWQPNPAFAGFGPGGPVPDGPTLERFIGAMAQRAAGRPFYDPAALLAERRGMAGTSFDGVLDEVLNQSPLGGSWR